MKRVMCVYMPFLPTDLHRFGDRSAGEDRRAIVLAADHAGQTRVVAACPRARLAGIRPGMSLANARALLATLTAAPWNPQAHQRELAALARWAERFTPAVQPVWPDVLLLDITGCAGLWNGEEHLAREVVRTLARRSIGVRVAVAETVGAAWAVAHGTDEPVVIVPPGQILPAVTPLPPHTLRIDAATAERLEAVGIRTIGDLLMLPRSALVARFGEHLGERLRLLLGETPEWVEPRHHAEPPHAIRWFGPADDAETVRAAIHSAADDLARRLKARGLGARRITCTLRREGAPPVSWDIGLSRPSCDARHIARLLLARLEQSGVSGPLRAVSLRAGETAPQSPDQPDLFAARAPRAREDLWAVVDRLAARLGSENVVQAELVEDYQPERACRLVPLVHGGRGAEADETAWGRRAAAKRRGGNGAALPAGSGATTPARPPARIATCFERTADPEGAPQGPRPLFLLPAPQPLEAVALLPDAGVIRFRWRGRDHVVGWCSGPERVETGWWRGDDVRRDYFCAETERGQRFWLFRDLNSGQWYLHGIYE